jgi:hypothetical protein
LEHPVPPIAIGAIGIREGAEGIASRVDACFFCLPRASERRHFGRRNMRSKNKPRRRRHFLLRAGQIIVIEWYVEAVLSPFLFDPLRKIKENVVATILKLRIKKRSTFSFLIPHSLFLIS